MKSSILPSRALLAATATLAPGLASAALAWKAGLSGYPGIESQSIFNKEFVPYISWYSNYNPVTPDIPSTNHTVYGAPMLWGKGDQCLTGSDGPVDAQRLQSFKQNVAPANGSAAYPAIFFGFYEPDCNCDSSSHIPDVATGLAAWNEYIAPLKTERGIILGSPPMCTQLDQSWLTEFVSLSNGNVIWDVTSIHVNKPTAAEGIQVVEYYVQKFGRPVWVSEFTCVEDQTWTSCGDQTAVNNFIDGMVEYFEGNDNVVAYGANNGEGVPGVWDLIDNSVYPPVLTQTGLHYQSVLQYLREENCP